MSLPSIPALLAVLLCAALFVLLFQHLFPRPAPWKLVAASVGAGIIATLILTEILRWFVPPGFEGLEHLTTISASLPFAILRAGLPEEATKALAAMIALVPFWRRATPAHAFQAALFAAVGFALVENQGYANAFGEFAVLIAFGRGFMATLTHTLLAMIFGTFLMRFAANGWRQWHLPIIGYLVAVACHSLYDAGLLPVLAEYVKTNTVDEATVLALAPFIVGGIALVLIAGLWSLRSAIRRAAMDDPIAAEPRHQTVVRRWRWSANTLLVLGVLGLITAIAWAVLAEAPEVAAADVTSAQMENALVAAIGMAGTVFAIILSWVLRQKR